MHNISSTICPSNRCLYRSLCLSHNHRYAIYHIYKVQTLASLLAFSRILPLIGHYTAILISIICFCEETNIDIIAIFAKRI